MKHETTAARHMHLAHCTSGGRFLEILNGLEILPIECPNYHQKLVYLFYGRPAFKRHRDAHPSLLEENAPVCFVIDASILNHAVRMFPFDSGGFERYARLLGNDLKVGDFEFGPEPDSPLRLISTYFGTLQNYYYQKARLDLKIQATSRAALGFHRLISDVSANDDDDRSGTIEVQIGTSINLATSVKAIVAPNELLSKPEVIELLRECPDATPLDYRLFGRMTPEQLSYAIYEKVEQFLSSERCFE